MRELRDRDRGQATVLLLACMALAVVAIVATAHFGARTVVHERAQAAADAAALAGAGGGRPAAARLAAANGGVLLSYRVVSEPGMVADPSVAATTVEVTVRVGDAVATARATRAP